MRRKLQNSHHIQLFYPRLFDKRQEIEASQITNTSKASIEIIK